MCNQHIIVNKTGLLKSPLGKAKTNILELLSKQNYDLVQLWLLANRAGGFP